MATFLPAAALLLLGGAAAEELVFHGRVMDRSVTACGVKISGMDRTDIVPFIQTHDRSGTVRLDVLAKSAGGTSRTSQSGRFAGNQVDLRTRLAGGADVRIELEYRDDQGRVLCRLQTSVVNGSPEHI